MTKRLVTTGEDPGADPEVDLGTDPRVYPGEAGDQAPMMPRNKLAPTVKDINVVWIHMRLQSPTDKLTYFHGNDVSLFIYKSVLTSRTRWVGLLLAGFTLGSEKLAPLAYKE